MDGSVKILHKNQNGIFWPPLVPSTPIISKTVSDSKKLLVYQCKHSLRGMKIIPSKSIKINMKWRKGEFYSSPLLRIVGDIKKNQQTLHWKIHEIIDYNTIHEVWKTVILVKFSKCKGRNSVKNMKLELDLQVIKYISNRVLLAVAAILVGRWGHQIQFWKKPFLWPFHLSLFPNEQVHVVPNEEICNEFLWLLC